MSAESSKNGHDGPREGALERRIEKLSKINTALMHRVERSLDQQASAFSLFQTAISLEGQIRLRTDELKAAMTRLEAVNNELMAARDAAELANRFKTRFFTAIGHDLLQPLHAARLSLSAIAEDELGASVLRLTQQIDHSLSTIEQMLRTILDLSKLEAGVIEPQEKDFALSEVLQSVVLEAETIARAKNLTLTLRPTSVIVRSDPLMLRRILQNLVANAVRYTAHGGVKIGVRRRGAMVRLDVWDTGPGIGSAEHARIFEEFQRGHDAEHAGTGGFGLGLSIVRRTADALNHKLDLCSRVDHGSRFSIALPYIGEAESCLQVIPVPTIRQAYGFATAKIVVVDNDTSVLSAMRTLLERWSCEARYAAGLAEISYILSREPGFRPDLIIADYHLNAGETGLGAIDLVREITRRSVPAVIVTADHSITIDEIAKAHGSELLRKPVKPAELRALIQHILS